MGLEIDEISVTPRARLVEQVREDSEFIRNRTALGVVAWDDPEDWLMQAVRLAHCVVALSLEEVPE